MFVQGLGRGSRSQDRPLLKRGSRSLMTRNVLDCVGSQSPDNKWHGLRRKGSPSPSYPQSLGLTTLEHNLCQYLTSNIYANDSANTYANV